MAESKIPKLLDHCECPYTGTRAFGFKYLPEELPVHLPNECLCTNDLAQYERVISKIGKTKVVTLCSCCFISSDKRIDHFPE